MHIRQIFFGIDFFPLNRRSIPLVIPQVVEGPGTRRHLEVMALPPLPSAHGRTREPLVTPPYSMINFDQKRPIWDRGGGGWPCFQKISQMGWPALCGPKWVLPQNTRPPQPRAVQNKGFP